MMLDQIGCSFGFDKSDKIKYKGCKDLIVGKKQLTHEFVIVILLAVREKCRPVTIVDHLRQRNAKKLLVTRSQHMLPKRKVAKEGLFLSPSVPKQVQHVSHAL